MATLKKKTEVTARPAQSERRATAKPSAETGSVAPSHDDVSARAFKLWEEGGCQPGQDLENWLRAERELSGAAQRS